MNRKTCLIYLASLLLLAPLAMAGNGHMLHGFGPVNSTMGGAGVALPMEPLGALMFNPALLTAEDGDEVTFSTEFFKDDIGIEVTLNDGSKGYTNPSNQVGVLPAIGWSSHQAGNPMAIGFGLVAVAGFRTDYPEDFSSILFSAPPGGFGRIYTDYRVTRVPFAGAFQINEKLSIGASLNGYLAELAIAPLPHKVFDEVDGTRYYAQGGNLVSEMAFSVQLGAYYKMNDALAFGASYTSAQDFDPFKWNSTIAHPDHPDFGQHRELDFDLDGPWNATAGVGYTPNDKIRAAFDVMYIKYRGVSGFGSPGGVVDGIVYPFGWRNIWIAKAGVEYTLNEKITVRAGYNHSQIPIVSEKVLTATGAPSMFKHHFSFGTGYQLSDRVIADFGFYYVPEESVEGPLPDLDNNEIGRMETSNSLTSVQVGLRFNF